MEEHRAGDPERQAGVHREVVVPLEDRRELGDQQRHAGVDDDAGVPPLEADEQQPDEAELHEPDRLALPALGDAEAVAEPHGRVTSTPSGTRPSSRATRRK